jgi:hypothetical protein
MQNCLVRTAHTGQQMVWQVPAKGFDVTVNIVHGDNFEVTAIDSAIPAYVVRQIEEAIISGLQANVVSADEMRQFARSSR